MRLHYQLGARFADYAGWEMPIQYESIITEHHNTRNAVSLFDVSHMGEIFIEGTDALSNLQRLTCNDVSRLSDGEVQYSALLYENGTFVDDVTVYRISNELYFLCVNASNTDKDFQWIQSNLEGSGRTGENRLGSIRANCHPREICATSVGIHHKENIARFTILLLSGNRFIRTSCHTGAHGIYRRRWI